MGAYTISRSLSLPLCVLPANHCCSSLYSSQLTFSEAPALAPPEVAFDAAYQAQQEQEIAEAAQTDIPDDEDDI